MKQIKSLQPGVWSNTLLLFYVFFRHVVHVNHFLLYKFKSKPNRLPNTPSISSPHQKLYVSLALCCPCPGIVSGDH